MYHVEHAWPVEQYALFNPTNSNPKWNIIPKTKPARVAFLTDFRDSGHVQASTAIAIANVAPTKIASTIKDTI